MRTRPEKRQPGLSIPHAALLCTALILLCWSTVWVHADDPQDDPTSTHTDTLFSKHSVRLEAGPTGPVFTLADLAAYTPVPRQPAQRPTIRPPVWDTYPPELADIPILPRTYPTDTVAYLTAHEIEHGDRSVPYVALSFDCESGTGSTRKILNTLQEQQVQATFFVLGRYAYLFPDLVRQIAEQGHEIGNHSFFHPLFTTIEPASATDEILNTEAIVDWAVGRHVPMRYIRFPYGGRNLAIRQHAAALGYQSAFWDIDPRGWDPETSPEDVVNHIRGTVHNGGIIIMHCGSWDDANALEQVIQAIRDSGRAPGTLTDVLTEQDWNIPDYPKTWPRRDQQ
jgi:peptidoglycan-N-acetylmuramic acid deacetylase